MNYEVKGEENNKLLVFINGAGISKWMWKYQQSLAKQYKCLFFDLLGHGENSNSNFTTIDAVCQDVVDLIKKESEEGSTVIIGLSIGAQIVLNLLKDYSEYISKAIIISGLNMPMQKFNFLLKPMIAMSMPMMQNKHFAQLQAKQFSLPKEWFESYYNDSLKISKQTLLNITKENMSFNFNTRIEGIPTLILTGEKEKRIMKKSAQKTSNYIKSSQYYIVKDASHGIPYEKPEVFNELLINFIENTSKTILNRCKTNLCIFQP